MIEGNKMKRELIGLLGVALSCLALTTGCLADLESVEIDENMEAYI